MASSYPYPDSATDEIRSLIGFVTGAKPFDLVEATHDGYIVTGFLLSMTVGETSDSMNAMNAETSADPLSDAEAIAALELFLPADEGMNCLNLQSTPEASGLLDRIRDLLGGGETAEPVTGTPIAGRLAAWLIPILLKWFLSWMTGGGLPGIIDAITPKESA